MFFQNTENSIHDPLVSAVRCAQLSRIFSPCPSVFPPPPLPSSAAFPLCLFGGGEAILTLLQPHTLRKVCVLGVLLGDALLCVTHLVLKEPLLDIPGGPVVRDPPTCGIREAPTHREQPSSHNTTSEPAHLESALGSKITITKRSACTATRESLSAALKTQCSQKVTNKI